MIFGKKKTEVGINQVVNRDKPTIAQISMPVKSSSEGKTAEDIRLIIAEWLDPKHIDYKTRLTPRQVRAVSILQSLADTYGIETLKRYLNTFQIKKLSEDGKSSKELENILKARIPELEQDGALGKLSRFLD